MNAKLPYSFIVALVFGGMVAGAAAQSPFTVHDDPVPRNLERMYKRGLDWLAKNQQSNGAFSDSYGSQPGVVGLAILAFLAHGEDPNYGPYNRHIKRGLKFIMTQQQASGYIQSSMYNHGFATLALAEAYGQVDDPKLGKALEKAVKLLLNSQASNSYSAWRYQSSSRDADTTVSGACMVALIAARNAGIEIPESSIKKALEYYRTCQSTEGGFGYTSPSSSRGPTSAIGTLVFALARKRKSAAYKAAISFLSSGSGNSSNYYQYYYLYYASQAFFHSTPKNWSNFNKTNMAQLESAQQSDGSWRGSHGTAFCTSGALLSLALNYRFLPIYER